MSQKITYIGHHGTDKKHLPNIFAEGFLCARKGYLGSGVYFYENNMDLAREWAENRRQCKKSTVLQAEIECDIDNILDISDPNCKERRLIGSQVVKYFTRRKQNGYYLNDNAMKEIEGNIIDDMCKRVNYKLIRAITVSNTQVYGDITIFLGIANGIELCVKDKSIINKIEEVI